MKRFTFLSFPVLFCLLSPTVAQHRLPVHPIAHINDDNLTIEPPATLTRHVDLARLQKDADDLARTAQTIPTDVASVRAGKLPKDILLKLKQIEKLSKHLRSELNQ